MAQDQASEPKRLLIIDDDESLREIFTLMMTKAGYRVFEAEDGVVGLARMKAFRPHLVVLDLMMPRLSGFEVIHRMQSEGLGDIPVVVITGFSQSASEQVVRQEPNVLEFLRKPIEYAKLTELIGRLLGSPPRR